MVWSVTHSLEDSRIIFCIKLSWPYNLLFLYNKKLLVGTVEPLWGYLSNPNLSCNTYLPEIICKLSESFVYNGRYYTPTINKLPNGLLPAVFVAKKMTELNDTDLSTFIKNPNSIAIFTCLCL